MRYMGARGHGLLWHFLGFALLVVPITTLLAWAPTYLSRVLGFARADSGFVLGVLLLVLSPASVYFGGWLIDRLQRRGLTDAPFRVGIGAGIALVPLSLAATTGSSAAVTLVLFCPLVFCACLSQAAAPALIQTMAPNQMRAQISAVWMLIMNLVSTIAGPTLAGFVTVYLFADDMAVGRSIAIVNVVSAPLAALLLWRGMHRFRREAVAVESTVPG